jgi:hypothetical protein
MNAEPNGNTRSFNSLKIWFGMKRLFLILELLLCISPCWAAVAFNNANTITRTAGNSFSGSESITAGSNLCAVLDVGVHSTMTPSLASAPTYNGVSMTLVPNSAATNTHEFAAEYVLVNPATGTNTLAISADANATDIYHVLKSFTGADQTTCYRTATGNTATGVVAAQSITITSDSGGDLTSANTEGSTAGNICTNGVPQTSDGCTTAGTTQFSGAHSTVSAASVSYTWTNTVAGSPWAASGFSIKASGSAACTPTLTLLGVGRCG